jgi:hypothetical protein
MEKSFDTAPHSSQRPFSPWAIVIWIIVAWGWTVAIGPECEAAAEYPISRFALLAAQENCGSLTVSKSVAILNDSGDDDLLLDPQRRRIRWGDWVYTDNLLSRMGGQIYGWDATRLQEIVSKGLIVRIVRHFAPLHDFGVNRSGEIIGWRIPPIYKFDQNRIFTAANSQAVGGFIIHQICPQTPLFCIDGGTPLFSRIASSGSSSDERQNKETGNDIFEGMFPFALGVVLISIGVWGGMFGPGHGIVSLLGWVAVTSVGWLFIAFGDLIVALFSPHTAHFLMLPYSLGIGV